MHPLVTPCLDQTNFNLFRQVSIHQFKVHWYSHKHQTYEWNHINSHERVTFAIEIPSSPYSHNKRGIGLPPMRINFAKQKKPHMNIFMMIQLNNECQ